MEFFMPKTFATVHVNPFQNEIVQVNPFEKVTDSKLPILIISTKMQ